MDDRLHRSRVDAREEAILESLICLYEAGELRCSEGRLRLAPLVDTHEIRLRGPSAWDYSLRFPESRFIELVEQSRVPISDELVRMLLCLIYHHPGQYAWATKEEAARDHRDAAKVANSLPPDERA